MGNKNEGNFTCPQCRKEFGLDQEALIKHFEENFECGWFAEYLLIKHGISNLRGNNAKEKADKNE